MSKRISLQSVYKIIREIQEDLHSEYVMSTTVEELFNQDFLQQFKNNYLLQMIYEKHYYTRILFMLGSSKINKLPFKNPTALYHKKSTNEIQNLPKILENISKSNSVPNFVTTVQELASKKCLNSTMIDIITFSLIPSFYSMFLESDSIDSFCQFIRILRDDEITRKLQYKLSRSLFISPMFMQFIRKVLHNVLQPIFNQPIPLISTKNVQQQIKQSFLENLHSIPSYISVFLNEMKDTFNFLKKCLFIPLINNPIVFLVVDVISESESKSEIDSFKNFLKNVFNDQLIIEIAQLVDQNKDSENSCFINQPKAEEKLFNVLKIEENTKIVDSIDLYAIKIIKQYVSADKSDTDNKNTNQKTSDNKNDDDDDFDFDSESIIKMNLVDDLNDTEYNIYEGVFTEKNDVTPNAFYNPTQIKSSDSYWMHFRKLLKDAPPLPKKYEAEDEDDDAIEIQASNEQFLLMVNDLLVNTGDPMTYADNICSFKAFSDDFKNVKTNFFTSEQKFREEMRKLVIEHKEQSLVMQRISQFKSAIDNMNKRRSPSFIMIENVFNSRMIDSYSLVSNADLPKRGIEIASDPLKFVYQFEDFFQKVSKQSKKFLGSPCNEIFYIRFFKNVDYFTFLYSRPEVRKLDMIFCEICKNYKNYDLLISKEKKIVLFMKDLRPFMIINEELKFALDKNSDPLTKYKDIKRVFDHFSYLLFRHFEIEGREETTPAVYLLILISRPINLISNIIYLLEFIYYRDDPIFSEFLILHVVYIIKDIIQQQNIFKKFQFLEFSRANKKTVEMFISGNDSEMIISTLNYFITKSNKKDEQPINDSNLIEKMDKNVGTVYSFSHTISALKFLEFHSIVNVDIRIGKNIKLISNSESNYNLKMAIYCFNEKLAAKSLFSSCPPEIKSFVNDNINVVNDNKAILFNVDYEPQFSTEKVAQINFNNFFNVVSPIFEKVENPKEFKFPSSENDYSLNLKDK